MFSVASADVDAAVARAAAADAAAARDAVWQLGLDVAQTTLAVAPRDRLWACSVALSSCPRGEVEAVLSVWRELDFDGGAAARWSPVGVNVSACLENGWGPRVSVGEPARRSRS